MFCTSCGGKLRDGAKFCIYCGAPQKVKEENAGFSQEDNFGTDGGYAGDPYAQQENYAGDPYAQQDGYAGDPYAQQNDYAGDPYAQQGFADNPYPQNGFTGSPSEANGFANNQVTEPLGGATAGLLVLQDTRDADKLYACDLSAPAIMGRDGASCNLVISDERSVSRRHCSFYRRGNACYVEDLKSFNHTWLNGNMVEGPTEIHVGDKLTLGAAELVVVECDFNQ